MTTPEFPLPRDVMPHRGRVLLLDRVLAHDPESTLAGVDVASQTWLKRDDGRVPAWVALEYMAQCVAVHEGVCSFYGGGPPVRGWVAAAVGLRVYRSGFAPDAVLHVHTRRVRGRPGLGAVSHACSLFDASDTGNDDRLLAEGRLSISIPVTARPPADA